MSLGEFADLREIQLIPVNRCAIVIQVFTFRGQRQLREGEGEWSMTMKKST